MAVGGGRENQMIKIQMTKERQKSKFKKGVDRKLLTF